MKAMVTIVFLTILCGVLAVPRGAVAGLTPPFNLQCEHNSVGISRDRAQLNNPRYYFSTDNPHPLLSWSVAHTERGAYQKAFRVIVSEADASFSSNVVWDTGIVTGEQQGIVYKGKPLINGEVYLWKVMWWDHEGKWAESEEIGHFMAVVGLDWTNVSWIVPPSGDSNAYNFVRKINLVGKQVKKAVLYVSGLGYFRAYVNNQDLHRLSDPPISLAPGWTNYEARIGYFMFDITELVIQNLNVDMMISLGDGYRNRTSFPPRDKNAQITADKYERLLRAQLMVNFSDGSESMLVKTDSQWEVHTSNIVASSVYDGEYYDATVADSSVGMASEVPQSAAPAGIMYLANIPPVVETGVYDSPVQIYTLASDSTKQIVDFGINFAGVVKINVADVKKGQSITMKHAEVLMHPPYGPANGALYTANLRDAAQLDTYVSNGVDKFYQPIFTYHGFRYIAVSNYPRNLTASDLKRIRISTNVKTNSKFNTSNPLLTKIQDNVVRGQASNLMTIPTDCDQRNERLGWMGDVGLSADSMAMNFQLQSYFPHRVMIIKDDQLNGSVPDVTPFYHGGRRPADPSWGAAYPQLVWVLMKQYKDMDTTREYYPSLMKYMDFMESEVPAAGISGLNGPYGDWVPPPEQKKIDNTFPSGFSLLANIQEMMEIAQAVKDDKMAANLSARFSKHADEFNSAFLVNGTYLDDIQISYALPLYLDIVPEKLYQTLSARFVNIFTDVDKYHITAGIIGTKYILPVLTKLKQNSAAIQCVSLIDYPSYGYMIHSKYEPATTIWELWNGDTGGPGMNSRNHHMFSSVSGWMQTDMIGFQQTKGTYGYKEMDLYPASSLDLSAASIELEYPQPVKYSWHRKGGLQCGKAAEDQSSLNPGLPKHDGLVISCGEGTISKVAFASYGNPTGVCGYHQYGECHSSKSIEVVEKQCLNHSECRVQTDGDFWGDPCPGLVEVKWLTVAVHCTTPNTHNELLNRYTSLTIDVSVPMKSTAHVNIPAYGMDNLEVWDGDKLAYASNKLLLETTAGISSASWVKERDILKLDIMSGDYSFTVKGKAPNETNTIIKYGREARGSDAQLKCSDDRHVISRIDWASYGDPVIDKYDSPSRGEHHSHVSHMIIDSMCVGRNRCTVPMDKDLFFNGSPHQFLKASSEWNLIVKFSCNFRG